MNDFNDKSKVSTTRMVLWIAVGAIGLYFIITGVYAGLSGNPLP